MSDEQKPEPSEQESEVDKKFKKMYDDLDPIETVIGWLS